MSRFLLIVSCLIFFLSASGQLPTDMRTEKIFLSTQQTDYTIDDTIKVHGMVTGLAHNHSAPYSRYVYVELLSPGVDSVIARNKVVIESDGKFRTDFTPEPDALKGPYFLRAYTQFMRNFSDASFAFHYITIGKPDEKDDGIIDEDVTCTILPIGSGLVPGIPQQIVGQLNNHLGYPLSNQRLALTDSDNDTIAVSTTSDAGFATFNFIPAADRNYTVKFSAMGVNKSFDVPMASASTSKISAVVKDDRLYFNVEGQKPHNRRIFTFDNSNGLSEIDATTGHGMIKLVNRPVGPVTVFLTDDTLAIISQHSVLPNNNIDLLLATNDTLRVDSEFSYNIGGLPADSIRTIVRFVPETELFTPPTAQQILLLSSDFQSPLPMPRPDKNYTQTQNDMQSWLGTATFTRFNLADAVRSDCNLYRIMPEQSLKISGTVFDDKRAKHPMKRGQIVAYSSFDRSVTDVDINETGRFTVEVNDFDEGTEFFLQAISSNEKAISAIIELDAVDYPEIGVLPLPPVRRNRLNEADVTVEGSGNGLRELPNIVVKARAQKVDRPNDKQFYSNRMKARDEIERRGYLTLFDIVRDMPYLRIVALEDGDGEQTLSSSAPGKSNYAVYTLRGASTLDGKNAALPIIVDGTVWDIEMSSFIWDWPASQIEAVEHLSVAESLLYSGKGLYGALSIRTKDMASSKPRESKGRRCWPEGLTPALNANVNNDVRAPQKEGRYNMFVDIVTTDGRVFSISKPVTVIK